MHAVQSYLTAYLRV